MFRIPMGAKAGFLLMFGFSGGFLLLINITKVIAREEAVVPWVIPLAFLAIVLLLALSPTYPDSDWIEWHGPRCKSRFGVPICPKCNKKLKINEVGTSVISRHNIATLENLLCPQCGFKTRKRYVDGGSI